MALTPVSSLLTAIAWRRSRCRSFVAAGILGGIGAVSVYNIAQVSLRQAITPSVCKVEWNPGDAVHRLGHDSAGALIGGALGSTVGLRETLFIGAAGSVLAPRAAVADPFSARYLRR